MKTDIIVRNKVNYWSLRALLRSAACNLWTFRKWFLWYCCINNARWELVDRKSRAQGSRCVLKLSELHNPAGRISFSSLGCLIWTGGELTPVCAFWTDFNIPERQLLYLSSPLYTCIFLSFTFSVFFFHFFHVSPHLHVWITCFLLSLLHSGVEYSFQRFCLWLWNEILIHRRVCCIRALY